MRKGNIKRASKETQIQIALTIEGRGRYEDLVGTSRYCRVGSLSDLGPEPAPEVMESALVVAG